MPRVGATPRFRGVLWEKRVTDFVGDAEPTACFGTIAVYTDLHSALTVRNELGIGTVYGRLVASVNSPQTGEDIKINRKRRFAELSIGRLKPATRRQVRTSR